MAVNLVIFGPPGAGKGTQAGRIGQARRVPWISTGDILRDAVQAGTALGMQAKSVMDRGELVGDELMVRIVRERLARDDTAGGFILDGFPRTVAQAVALDEMLVGRDPLIVIELSVPDAELAQRLSRRRVCGRSDDREEVVRERLRVYHEQTQPLVAFYEDRPSFRRVDGSQPPDAVNVALGAAIDEALAGARPPAGAVRPGDDG